MSPPSNSPPHEAAALRHCRRLGLGLGTLLLFRAATALGQACCAGGAAYQPARLKLHEDWLVGLSVQGSTQLGSADQFGGYHPTPAGSGEQDYTESILATVRLFDRGQL